MSRDDLIQRYCTLMKKSRALTQFCTLIGVINIVKKLAHDFKFTVEANERKLKTIFVCIIIKYAWLRKMK